MRLLIVGASGFLGSNVALQTTGSHDVVAHSSTLELAVPGAASVVTDLLREGSGRELVETAAPDLVLNCAALADVDVCERSPEVARRLNVEMPRELASACANEGISLVHVSTDAVFGGAPGPYAVQTPVSPVNVYGRTKAEGEAVVRDADPSALVVRTNIVGFSPTGRRSLLEYFLSNFEAGTPAPGFVDVSVRPLVVDAFWPLVSGWTAADRTGLVHATGTSFVSKYEFGRCVARAFGYEEALVRRSSVAERGLDAARGHLLDVLPTEPADGVDPHIADLDVGLTRLRRSAADGLRSRLSALLNGRA